MVPIWPKITQPYIILTVLDIFRNILVWCSAIVIDISQISQFSQKNFIRLAIRVKITQPYSHDLLCEDFFVMMYHDGIQLLNQINVGQLFRKISFWRSSSHPIWPKIMQTSVLGFALKGFLFEMLQDERIQKVDNINIQFYLKIFCRTNGHLRPSLGQNYAELCFSKKKIFMRGMGILDQIAPNYVTLYFMIHFNAVCEMLSSIMGYNT